jgi:hypothetical protein
MSPRRWHPSRTAWSIGLALLLQGCQGGLRPLPGLNQQLARLGSGQSPSLGTGWLALIASREGGRPQVQLIDSQRQLPVPLPGLNRADSLPIQVSVDARVLYRRSLMAVQPIAIDPAGVPRQVSLSADGRVLAVEVSRGGLWQIDLLELP